MRFEQRSFAFCSIQIPATQVTSCFFVVLLSDGVLFKLDIGTPGTLELGGTTPFLSQAVGPKRRQQKDEAPSGLNSPCFESWRGKPKPVQSFDSGGIPDGGHQHLLPAPCLN